MKRWIHAATDRFDLSKKVPNKEYSNLTVEDAIDSMTYSIYDNYKDEEDIDYDFILDVIIEHLDAPDIYNLKVGRDYSKQDVMKEMDKYSW